MKTTTGVAAVFASVLLLAGCTVQPASDVKSGQSSEEGEVYGTFREFDITLTDGRVVMCLYNSNGNASSMSCDWPNARKQ